MPQQETKSSAKQLAPTDPILGPENLLKTGFAQKSLVLAKETKKRTLIYIFRKVPTLSWSCYVMLPLYVPSFPADVSGVLGATLSCGRYSIAHLPATHSHIHIE